MIASGESVTVGSISLVLQHKPNSSNASTCQGWSTKWHTHTRKHLAEGS